MLPVDNVQPVRVAAGLIHKHGLYLITKRKAEVHLGGFWEFPGGKCLPQESLEDCLRRELREELGIEITTPNLFRTVYHKYPDSIVELHFFRCSVAIGEPQPYVCDQICWVPPSQLQHYSFPPADTSLIQELASLSLE